MYTLVRQFKSRNQRFAHSNKKHTFKYELRKCDQLIYNDKIGYRATINASRINITLNKYISHMPSYIIINFKVGNSSVCFLSENYTFGNLSQQNFLCLEKGFLWIIKLMMIEV